MMLIAKIVLALITFEALKVLKTKVVESSILLKIKKKIRLLRKK